MSFSKNQRVYIVGREGSFTVSRVTKTRAFVVVDGEERAFRQVATKGRVVYKRGRSSREGGEPAGCEVGGDLFIFDADTRDHKVLRESVYEKWQRLPLRKLTTAQLEFLGETLDRLSNHVDRDI